MVGLEEVVKELQAPPMEEEGAEEASMKQRTTGHF